MLRSKFIMGIAVKTVEKDQTINREMERYFSPAFKLLLDFVQERELIKEDRK